MAWGRRGKGGHDAVGLGNWKDGVAVFGGLKKAEGEQIWGGGGGADREDQTFGFGPSRSDVPVKYPCGDAQSRGVAKM